MLARHLSDALDLLKAVAPSAFPRLLICRSGALENRLEGLFLTFSYELRAVSFPRFGARPAPPVSPSPGQGKVADAAETNTEPADAGVPPAGPSPQAFVEGTIRVLAVKAAAALPVQPVVGHAARGVIKVGYHAAVV